jgi:predicted alpha/beta hydrolase
MTGLDQPGRKRQSAATPAPVDGSPVTSDHVIVTDDGRELAATTVQGRSADTVVVAGGVAIRRGFYREFATWLAGRGPTVITFDYRDLGGSRTMPLRDSPARMADWGRHDIDAVLQHAAARTTGQLLYVGHSAGGQLLGLTPFAERLDRIVTVATQSGYWRVARPPERYRLWLLWHIVFPTAIRAAGYLPGRWLGLGNDLPAGIANDWIRWCRDPAYLFGDAAIDQRGYQRVHAPIRAHLITDDPWASSTSVSHFHRRYSRCPVEVVVTAPRHDRPIGHSGLFRTSTGSDHWPALASWLLGQR